jgi:tetratricopeptide (TPR) repeat protein
VPLSATVRIPEEAIGDEQREWIHLVERGYLPERPVGEEPRAYVLDDLFYERLRESVGTPQGAHWYSYMHLGVMEYARGHVDAAYAAFEHSVSLQPSAWCCRNLAMLCRSELGRPQEACAWMRRAVACLDAPCRGVYADAATTLIEAGDPEGWLHMYATLDASVRADGRLRLLCARALILLNRPDEATEYLNAELHMPDIKEGDTSVSDLWFALYGALIARRTGEVDLDRLRAAVEREYPLGELDFRTH